MRKEINCLLTLALQFNTFVISLISLNFNYENKIYFLLGVVVHFDNFFLILGFMCWRSNQTVNKKTQTGWCIKKKHKILPLVYSTFL